jgi:hypothetical protein
MKKITVTVSYEQVVTLEWDDNLSDEKWMKEAAGPFQEVRIRFHEWEDPDVERYVEANYYVYRKGAVGLEWDAYCSDPAAGDEHWAFDDIEGAPTPLDWGRAMAVAEEVRTLWRQRCVEFDVVPLAEFSGPPGSYRVIFGEDALTAMTTWDGERIDPTPLRIVLASDTEELGDVDVIVARGPAGTPKNEK